MSNLSNNIKLVDSLTARVGPAGEVQDILDWLIERNRQVRVDIDLVDFDRLSGWHFNSDSGDLEHVSGKFFGIRGVEIRTDGFPLLREHWTQPIIDQPEVGILGIICRMIDGVLCFLMQAKIEPGNLNCVQLSPTLQATRSNYMQVHKGKAPRCLEYFRNAGSHQIWLDQLQSEQGGRFLHKRNRNIVIEVEEEIASHPDFVWVTLGQLKALMRYDNVVNMDTRTVLSGLGWDDRDILPVRDRIHTARGHAMLRSLEKKNGGEAINRTLFWLSELKSRYSLNTRLIPLNQVKEWDIRADEIVRPDGRFFRVIGARVLIENREVASWDQPLIQPMQDGLCALIMKQIDGVMHFLVQAKLECGNLDVVELAPTVQCLTGSFRSGLPHFLDYVLNARREQIIFDINQSEEGGRFYHEQNRNLLLEAEKDFPKNEIPDNFRWVALRELREFLRFNNYLNIQLRSLLAAIDLFNL